MGRQERRRGADHSLLRDFRAQTRGHARGRKEGLPRRKQRHQVSPVGIAGAAHSFR